MNPSPSAARERLNYLSFVNRDMMIRGQCFWFYQANPGDGRPIRKCRHGSLCRFQHLTRRETDEILRLHEEMRRTPEKTTSECLLCDGSGQTSLRVETVRADGTTERDTTMPCFGCRGRGRLDEHPCQTRIRRIYDRAHGRDWCECRDRPVGASRYHADNTHPKCDKHCYTCTLCHGLTQIG